jgi:hypothetical protein
MFIVWDFGVMKLRILLATTFVSWALRVLRKGDPGLTELAKAQIVMCEGALK